MEKHLPNNWSQTKLEEIIEFVIGGDWGKDPNVFKDENYKEVLCIRGGEIKNWRVNKGNTASLRLIKDSSLEKRKLKEGDILLEISGGGPDQPVGRSLYIDKEVLSYNRNIPKVCTNFLRLVRLYNNLDSNYINYYLQNFYNSGEVVKYQGGSNNLRNLKFKDYQTITIPLAPIKEQKRIAEKLDDLFTQLDEVKKRLDNIPNLLKSFRQAVLNQAVTGKLTEEWRKGKDLENGEDWRRRIIKERRKIILSKRTPGLEFEEVPFPNDIPEKWTFGYLQNFGEFTRGKSKHRPRNDKRLFGGDYPFIQTGDVARSNGLIENYTQTYSKFGLSQSRLFPKGTLCITIAANIAQTGILNFDSCFPDSVVGYLPYKNLYSSKFAMYYLRTIQQDLEHYAPATAQKNINLGILFKVAFPVPPKEEQDEIVKQVGSIFSKADGIQKQYETLQNAIENLPQAILQKAFKGELVAQLPTDGNAKELLEEIKKLKEELKSKGKKSNAH